MCDWVLTLRVFMKDHQNYEKFTLVYKIRDDSFLHILRTLNGDIAVEPRYLHYLNGNPLTKDIVIALDATELMKKGDPDHLHIDIAHDHLQKVQEQLSKIDQKAARALEGAIELLTYRRMRGSWHHKGEYHFRKRLGYVLALTMGLEA